MEAIVAGENFKLLSEKVLFWQRKETLLLADLHMGKVSHFRKSGIPVPVSAADKNVELLISVIQQTKPRRVVMLGDLFHSAYNEEWEALRSIVLAFPGISFELVVGNHDILSQVQYHRSNIHLHGEAYEDFPFILTHHPLENIPDGLYNLAGHVHPGVQLTGRAKQSVTLPCFYFGEQQGILPAFGAFTGLAKIKPRQNDQIFVVADKEVVKL
jgi:DNA ligase-associated metallophosphoesterase